ncbi:MAG TPA: hypothetical protein VGK67_10235 [Myxococcales bacterium]
MQRERAVLLGQVHLQQGQGLVGDGVELLGGRDREAHLLRQGLAERLHVEVAQLDQVRAQPPAVDDLHLERILELLRRDQLLCQQDAAEPVRHIEPWARPTRQA